MDSCVIAVHPKVAQCMDKNTLLVGITVKHRIHSFHHKSRSMFFSFSKDISIQSTRSETCLEHTDDNLFKRECSQKQLPLGKAKSVFCFLFPNSLESKLFHCLWITTSIYEAMRDVLKGLRTLPNIHYIIINLFVDKIFESYQEIGNGNPKHYINQQIERNIQRP